MLILGIESSCDESALAILDEEEGLLGDWVHSQVALHQAYGGVVPDLASREHIRNFPPLLALLEDRLDGRRIDLIAVTQGPGLAGCLALGLALAKSLAILWNRPLVGINHLRGHAFSPFMGHFCGTGPEFARWLRPYLPHLGLIVSGGNTILFLMECDRSVEILAQTVDDASGEALDKGAKLLGLPYPGGPEIEQLGRRGDPTAFSFPRAFRGRDTMKYSFSGLKTSLRYQLEKMNDAEVESARFDLCASYEEAVVDALVAKVGQALDRWNVASLGLSGGVANNRKLRGRFTVMAEGAHLDLFLTQPRHTGDNAAMIAFAASVDGREVRADAGLDLTFHPTLTLCE